MNELFLEKLLYVKNVTHNPLRWGRSTSSRPTRIFYTVPEGGSEGSFVDRERNSNGLMWVLLDQIYGIITLPETTLVLTQRVFREVVITLHPGLLFINPALSIREYLPNYGNSVLTQTKFFIQTRGKENERERVTEWKTVPFRVVL